VIVTTAGSGAVSHLAARLKRPLTEPPKRPDGRSATAPVKRHRDPAKLNISPFNQAVAVLPAARLQQARTLVETLGLIGLPSAVLGPAAEVLAVNKLFGSMRPGLVRELRGSSELSNCAAARLIGEAIAQLNARIEAGVLRAIPLRAQGGKPPAILYVMALRGIADGPLSGAAILVSTPVLPRPAPNSEILRGLFDLSPAEARVARGIAARETVEGIADRCGVSRETVRSQLKTVLAKTGTKRQVDLAVLLAGLRLGKS
jgi:DNA-binding CsgD family transcriptional regulator